MAFPDLDEARKRLANFRSYAYCKRSQQIIIDGKGNRHASVAIAAKQLGVSESDVIKSIGAGELKRECPSPWYDHDVYSKP